ncbi:MBL fold metallo-hydrolase [Streptomyces colonosanans]|uniref:MBL fold metallo-hydrolase n=1 Tax=Streptomyces colonosanans TaxID=1428652 RepID=A0A1S2PFV1_9ACTN|nr:MBL fold metallo-hydrolase [Streptomyces colonosanans]OIJ92500.1 MBL fold metallo-hydrolase [Streptomyces colonosanans]
MTAAEPYTLALADDVHAYVQPDGGWCLNNAGFVSDGTATLLVDTTATERRTRALGAAVAATGAPAPRWVVNTHHHGDHTYGNGFFAPAATIVSHVDCRREALAAGRQLELIWPGNDYGDIRIQGADLTYRDRTTVHAGGVDAEVIHPGVAHTVGDSVVWLPHRRVLFAGDLVFEGGTPFFLMGSLSGSLRALERLRALGAETVVPGHGPVTDPSAFDRTERYLHFVADVAQRNHAAGRTPLEAARATDLGGFAELRERERLVANLHRAYAELDGLPEGAPLDPLPAFQDMALMNGGEMVTSHA